MNCNKYRHEKIAHQMFKISEYGPNLDFHGYFLVLAFPLSSCILHTFLTLSICLLEKINFIEVENKLSSPVDIFILLALLPRERKMNPYVYNEIIQRINATTIECWTKEQKKAQFHSIKIVLKKFQHFKLFFYNELHLFFLCTCVHFFCGTWLEP